MIFVIASKHDCIQETTDCHHFLLLKRVHKLLHTRQTPAMRQMKEWYLICCIRGPSLGI